MTNEGDRPRSSWQSWVRSSATRRTAPEPPTSATPPPSDLDVELEWSEGADSTSSPAPSLDAGLSWEPEATAVVPRAAAPAPAPAADVDAGAAFDDAPVADADRDVEVVDEVVDEAAEYDDDPSAVDADRDVEVEDVEPDDDHGGGELLPAVPLLPSIAGRVEALSGLLRSISMRVDGLTAVTDVYRANVTDRIDEYTETVLQLSRQSDQALDEHRRSSERAIGELRRTASDRGEAVGQLVSRVEELATDVATLREMLEVLIDTMPASAEGSGNAPLTRVDLDESVDVIADAVVARIDTSAIVEAVVARIQEAFEVVSEPTPTPPPAPAPAPEPRPAAPTAADLLDAGLASIDAPIEPAPASRRRGGRIARDKR
jgi:hypothetical protein